MQRLLIGIATLLCAGLTLSDLCAQTVVAPSASPDGVVASAESLSTCVTAIAAQSDPAKLATLGSRGANPRLKRIVYWLAVARDTGADPATVIDQAQALNKSAGSPRAPLVKASLLRNLKICDGLGMLTPINRERLRRGGPPVVTRGPYTGQTAEVDHIVPLAYAPEVGNELANLELLPAALNRAKSARVGERQIAIARQFRAVGLITQATMALLETKFRPSATARLEVEPPNPVSAAVPGSTPATNLTAPTPTPTPATNTVMVWVNTKTHVYHYPHQRWYGRTAQGKYMAESDAIKEGDRATRNRQ